MITLSLETHGQRKEIWYQSKISWFDETTMVRYPYASETASLIVIIRPIMW